MGRPYIEGATQLTKNAWFGSSSFWTPAPPWVIGGGSADWNFAASTGINELTQDIAIGVGVTYQTRYTVEIIGGNRGVNLRIGDGNSVLFDSPGIYTIESEQTPGDVTNGIRFIVALGPVGTSVKVSNISIIGEMVGDPMYDMLFGLNFRGMGLQQTEIRDLGGGETEFRIAARDDASNALIKTE